MASRLDDSMEDGNEELSDDMNESEMDLLWKGVVKPEEPLVASPVERYFLRITNACLGPEIQKNTRTCLQVAQQDDEESEPPGVVCTLRNNYENHPLKLLVSADVQFTVTGENPSPIYLVGYWTPAEQHMGDVDTPFDFGDEMDMDEDELTEEEMKDMDEKTKRKLLQQIGRKRKLDEMEEAGDEDGEKLTSAQKKQKTATGKAKPTNQPQAKNDNKNKNQNQNQNQKNQNKNKKQNSQQANETAVAKTQEAATGDEKETESGKGMTIKQTKTTETVVTEITNKTPAKDEGNDSNKQAKDDTEDKGWKNGPQGLKYKDIRAGDGKPVKKGAKIRVFYVGQLPNKKVFDKNIEDPGFEFKLGDGEVIQGWEKGLFGMKAGGKRRLVVPAKLAYGEEGSMPDIPPNTELTFTIEVKDVN